MREGGRELTGWLKVREVREGGRDMIDCKNSLQRTGE